MRGYRNFKCYAHSVLIRSNILTVNVLKFRTLFSVCSQIKCWFSKFQNSKRETLIRLLLQKQSDLGLPCLSRPFGLATRVQNFRTFTVYVCMIELSDFEKGIK